MRIISDLISHTLRTGRRTITAAAMGIALGTFLLAAPPTAPAQSYQLHQWTNFEDGKIPSDCFPIGSFFDTRAKVVEIASVAGAAPGFHDDRAKKELGRYCIALNPEWPAGASGTQLIGFAAGVVLDRRALGEKGRALFQADVYIPPAPERVPNIAVLSLAPLQGPSKSIVDFYRYGFTSDRDVYFSYFPKGATVADFYKYSKTFLKQLPRGHWHRLALVCQGPEQMRCFIDGIEAPFSPFSQGSMKEMQVGVLLFEKDKKAIAYADNLSIQFSPDDAPLPISPWLDSWPPELAATAGLEKENPVALGSAASAAAKKKTAATPTAPDADAVSDSADAPDAPAAAPAASGQVPHIPFVARAAAASKSVAPVGGSVKWLDTNEGWAQASSTGKPMLVAFLAPNLPSCQHFTQEASGQAAAATLAKYVPILIDVNQLQGGDLARKFGVFKVPTLVVLDAKGAVQSKLIVEPKDKWAAIEGKLAGR